MRTYTVHPILQPVEDKIICNKCGKTYDMDDCLEEWQADFMKNFKASFGYASTHDGEQVEFDLCEGCLLEFMASFKIPAKVENWLE